jgi:hypothetical protein
MITRERHEELQRAIREQRLQNITERVNIERMKRSGDPWQIARAENYENQLKRASM